MKKQILIGLVLIFLIGIVSAQQDSLGVYQVDECINLIQLCETCSNVTITSVLSPNSTVYVIDINMTKRGSEYNYSFCNTSELGRYFVNGVGDDGEGGVWVYYLDVTPNGETLSISKGIIQIGALISFVIFFLIALKGLFVIEDYKGRFAIYWVCHVLAIAISFISWQMANDYLTGVPFIAGMFKIIFYFIFIGAFPMVIMSLVWIFYIHLMNKHIRSMMGKGMDEDEAFERTLGRNSKW